NIDSDAKSISAGRKVAPSPAPVSSPSGDRRGHSYTAPPRSEPPVEVVFGGAQLRVAAPSDHDRSHLAGGADRPLAEGRPPLLELPRGGGALLEGGYAQAQELFQARKLVDGLLQLAELRLGGQPLLLELGDPLRPIGGQRLELFRHDRDIAGVDLKPYGQLARRLRRGGVHAAVGASADRPPRGATCSAASTHASCNSLTSSIRRGSEPTPFERPTFSSSSAK